jgi:hypothetical protein
VRKIQPTRKFSLTHQWCSDDDNDDDDDDADDDVVLLLYCSECLKSNSLFCFTYEKQKNYANEKQFSEYCTSFYAISFAIANKISLKTSFQHLN